MADSLQEILVDLADRGLKVMFVAYPDACRACRKLQGRVFDPLEAPSIPVDECLTPPCRCRYEAYDPRVVVAKLLAAGVDAVKEQRLEEAKEMLYQVIDLDERNDKAWLWLSGVVEGTDERIICLENVLTINPDHEPAKQGLRHLLTHKRTVSAGEEAARKIKEAREAIDHLRSAEVKMMSLQETTPVAATPDRPEADRQTQVGISPMSDPAAAPGPRLDLAMVLLLVLLGVSVVVLIAAASTIAGTWLR
jgi:tetratricopeptide (TPR) repeat protein